MKQHLLAFALLLISAAASFADAGTFVNEIVQPGDKTLAITVGERRFIRIVNFIQEAGTTRGLLAVTKANAKAAFVLSATLASESEVQKDFIVAGPATVTIDPVAEGKLFITYRLAKNAD